MTVQQNHIDRRLRTAWAPGGAHLPAHAAEWLRDRIGLASRDTPVHDVGPLPEPALTSDARASIAAVVGDANVRTGREDRLGVAGGLSYLDLLRHRTDDAVPVPDAVVLPNDPDEVQRVIEVCASAGIAVVPFGGGTSVVGGVRALRGRAEAVVVLDLARLDRLVSVDPVSRLAVFQAGVTAPEAERLLAGHGLTLGHVPQSFERATIGGFAATRSSGQASAGYGRFEDMVEGVRMATPRGEWRLGVAPASAAGPDLRQLVVGSEGVFGVITEVTVRVRRAPVLSRHEGFLLDGWQRGADAVRALAQRGALGTVTRLSDPQETDLGLTLSGGWKTKVLRRYARARGITEPCLLIVGWEGQSRAELAARRRATLRVLRPTGAVALGRAVGEAWRRGRFSGPRQRDALMDMGVCVETLETSTYWAHLSALRERVRAALVGSLTTLDRRPVVACHISHSYETGASLYFTVIVPADSRDPLGQWESAKAAACAAIVDSPQGTITHHHAVGADHAPYLRAEIGDLGVDVLAAVKRELDPDGVLNPGKLLPPR